MCRIGSGPLAPGWYLFDAFRPASYDVPMAGPFATEAEAAREWLWHIALQWTQFDRARSSGSARNFYDPIVAIRQERIRVAPTARIDSFVKLEGGEGMMIGEHVHIASFCHLGIGGGRTILEDGSSFGSGAKVISGSNVPGLGHGCSAIAPDAVFARSFAHVKRNATLFAGAMVLPGVTVGENAVLAAGAVARRDVPAGEIWGGVPARKIGVVK